MLGKSLKKENRRSCFGTRMASCRSLLESWGQNSNTNFASSARLDYLVHAVCIVDQSVAPAGLMYVDGRRWGL